tara:strand:+ start:337 stop:507 length:171 start_codon:yes stop_codon:yes gene_type:complete
MSCSVVKPVGGSTKISTVFNSVSEKDSGANPKNKIIVKDMKKRLCVKLKIFKLIHN